MHTQKKDVKPVFFPTFAAQKTENKFMAAIHTAERHSANLATDNVLHQRHMVAYNTSAELISGSVLEVGAGEGYGLQYLVPKSQHYMAIDKFNTNIPQDLQQNPKFRFMQMNVPPFHGLADNSFDYVVSFQVIEHIEGKLIVTTPNIKMSLTRNPWHVREYTTEGLQALMQKVFSKVDMQGVFGNEKVMAYYEANKASVRKITRFDVFNFQYRLPRRVLQIPYDILNRVNRHLLHKKNTAVSSSVQAQDYYLAPANDQCFDLFVIAEKI